MAGTVPKEFSPKKAILSGIAFFASIMMLFALCYFLIVGEESVYLYGYYIGGDVVTESGFTMLKFSSPLITRSFQWGAVLIGLLCLLQLLASIALIVGNVLSFLLLPKKKNKAITMVSVIVSTVFSFLYMLEGIIFTAVCDGTMSGTFITFAYLPFIFAVLIAVAYFVCFFVIKEEDEKKPAPAYGYAAYAYDSMTGEPVGEEAAPEEETPGDGGKGRLSPDKADMLLMNFKSFIPEEKVPAFRYALGKASAGCYTALSMVPLKNPMTVLLFSIFLGGFGVDRFYIGDTGMGVAKLLVGGLTLGIWPLVDIFMCYKKAKEQNFDLLMSALRVAR